MIYQPSLTGPLQFARVISCLDQQYSRSLHWEGQWINNFNLTLRNLLSVRLMDGRCYTIQIFPLEYQDYPWPPNLPERPNYLTAEVNIPSEPPWLPWADRTPPGPRTTYQRVVRRRVLLLIQERN